MNLKPEPWIEIPDFTQSLKECDLGHLRIVAELWGIEFNAPDSKVGLPRLVDSLLEQTLVVEQYNELPDDAKQAIVDLAANGGRITWAQFSRRYGFIREMGTAKRDRERPYVSPESISELLWYRAWIARAFMETPDGPEEFAYVPTDLLVLAGVQSLTKLYHLGRPASLVERAVIWPAEDYILDHACTLLAGIRTGIQVQTIEKFINEPCYPIPVTVGFLKDLLLETGVLDEQCLPVPEPTRVFLEAERGEALSGLTKAWLASPRINDLRMIPGILAEGSWQNDPVKTRKMVVNFIIDASGADRQDAEAQEFPWLSLSSFIGALKQHQPDFQRPAGDYDSWFLRDQISGEYLRGFENWDMVEGALLKYVIAGPLHWLGLVDLGKFSPDELDGNSAEQNPKIGSFRLNSRAKVILNGVPLSGEIQENEPIRLNTEGEIWLSTHVPRVVRYQIARFCSWEEVKEGIYYFRLTPTSLTRAQAQGLKVNQLLALLRKYAQNIPPKLVKALERWDASGSEAHFEQVVLLRLRSPEILQALRSGRASRYIHEVVSPTAAIIKLGALRGLKAALAEMGYLVDTGINSGDETDGED